MLAAMTASALRTTLISLAVLGLPGCGTEERPRPNVILIVFDTLRADRLSFHGGQEDPAPFLTRLAGEGVVFEHAWSTSSWTVPAMASLFTSVYPNQHNCWAGLNNLVVRSLDEEELTTERLPDELETLAGFLQGQGYRTFGISDNPNLCETLGFERGFDRLRSFHYGGAETVEAALDRFLGQLVAQEPWFLFLQFMDPHEPYHRRKPWLREPAADEALAPLAAYDSEISYADHHLERIFEKLSFDREDTFVILTADHGEEFGDHGGQGHGFQLYSELTHVPLVLLHPGTFPVTGRVAANVSLVDVLPTVRDLLGHGPAPQDEGHSLLPYYLEGRTPAARALFSMRSGFRGHKTAVIRGRHKLIRTEGIALPELYDLEEDPDELRDLAADHPELAAELEDLWERFETGATEYQAYTQVDLTEEQMRTLDRLGYGGATEFRKR